MAREFPHLKLIKKAAPEQVEEVRPEEVSGFVISSLAELPEERQASLRHIVSELSPGAAVLGLQKTFHAADDRLVIVVSGEGNPSLIRTELIEAAETSHIHVRLQELLERLVETPELVELCKITEWGIYGEQLFYRREVVNKTLSETLTERSEFGFTDALKVMRNLLGAIEILHSNGIVHGHITSNNIALDEDFNVSLLDPGVGVAGLQAAVKESFPKSYIETFAPETRESESLVFSTDIYGLGLVGKKLFSRISGVTLKSGREVGGEQTFIDVLDAMCDENPARRPKLVELRDFLAAPEQKAQAAKEQTPVIEKPVTRAPKGRLVQVRKAPISTFETEVAPKVLEEAVVEEPKVEQASAQQAEPSPAVSAIFEQPAAKSLDIEPSAKEPASWGASVFLFVLILSAGIIGIRSFTSEGEVENTQIAQTSNQELELAWRSGRPSLMAKVANQAINTPVNQFAELLIINSILRDEVSVPGVNYDLMKVAFDPRWEAGLSSDDKRLVLALSLGGLPGTSIPKDLPELDQAHPGALLAIAATSGDNVASILSQVPAKILTDLQAPLGTAFSELLYSRPNLPTGSEEVRLLSSMIANGIQSDSQIASLLEVDSESGMRALSKLSESSDSLAEDVLNVIYSGTYNIDSSLISWGEGTSVVEWQELSNNDKLALVAGYDRVAKVSVENIARLFAHPLPRIRRAAIERSIKEVPFKHRASAKILKMVAADPELLKPTQTLELASFLESPETASPAKIEKWLENKPSMEIVVELLAGGAMHSSASVLDFELSRYVQQSSYRPKVGVLRTLANHPDELTRMYAYSKIYELSNKAMVVDILQAALVKESNPDFSVQLERMIGSLR